MATYQIKELHAARVWLSWSPKERDGKTTKIPIDPNTGAQADATDPAQRSTYEQAEKFFPASRVGLALGGHTLPTGEGLFIGGIDIDAHGGEENPLAPQILEEFKETYIERSPSGKGYHILFLYDPEKLTPEALAPFYTKNAKSGLEMYVKDRYFTFTGNRLEGAPEALQDMTGEIIDWFLPQYMAKARAQSSRPTKATRAPEAAPAQLPPRLDIIRAAEARGLQIAQGFSALYDRGQGSDDESSNDYQLCAILYSFMDGDPAQIDTAFRASALMRDKWDERRGPQTYAEITLRAVQTETDGSPRKIYSPAELARIWKSGEKPHREKEGAETDGSPQTVGERPRMTIPELARQLSRRGYSVYFDVIKQRLTVLHNGSISEETPETICTLLHSEIGGIYKNCSLDILKQYFMAIGATARRNIPLEIIEGLEWDGKNRLPELYELFRLTPGNTLEREYLHKWLLQACALLSNMPGKNYSADGILVFRGRQGAGKSLAAQALAGVFAIPELELYFQDQITIKADIKDTQIKAVECFVGEFAEFDSTTRRRENGDLKAFITAREDNIRRPYAHSATVTPRRSSYIATVNPGQFLQDETGSRRFWVIDFGENILSPEKIKRFPMAQMWAQIWAEFKAAERAGRAQTCYRLTPTERENAERVNEIHRVALPAEDEIRDIIARANEHPAGWNWRRCTVSEFKQEHEAALRQYSAQQIGRALQACNISQERKKDGRFYRLPFKATSYYAGQAIIDD